MKAIIIQLLALFVVTISASAQIGLNNNSDWKVPVPVFVPQFAPSNATGLSFPPAPNIPTIPTSLSSALMPSAPATPNIPAAPNLTTYTAAPAQALPYTLPYLQTLLPLPRIRPFPPLNASKN